MTKAMCPLLWRFAIILSGLVIILSGIYLYENWIDIFTRMRGKKMALSPKSPAYSGWKVSPLPLSLDVYLFNWTNPEDFYAGSKKKPHFEELGPYRFREKPDKVDIEWHKQNYSMSFRKKAFYYFDAAGSNGRLDDKITTINTVIYTIALRSRDLGAFSKYAIKKLLSMNDPSMTVTKSAEEWMFKGYTHNILTFAKFLTFDVPYDRIGWMYKRNGSSHFDGHFNMHTGSDDIYKMGSIYSWNGKTHTGAYDDVCGEVSGSMGEFFPPNLKTNDTIKLFLPNLCRAVPLDYTETVKIHGVTAYKFSGTEHAVDNGTLYPETKCYCVNKKCEPAGVINLAPCKYDAPVYISYPHFYKADPSYLEAIDGLKPVKEKHEFFMSLEPNAGVPLDVGGGFQMNYLLEPIQDMLDFSNITRTFIPIMWAEERVRVTEEIAAEVALVPLIVLLGQIVTGVLLSCGLICTCWYPTRMLTRTCHADDNPKGKATPIKPKNEAAKLEIHNISKIERGTVSEKLLSSTSHMPTDNYNNMKP